MGEYKMTQTWLEYGLGRDWLVEVCVLASLFDAGVDNLNLQVINSKCSKCNIVHNCTSE